MIEEIEKLIKKYSHHKVEDLGTYKPGFLAINIKKYYLNNGATIIRDTLIKPTKRAAIIIPKTINNTYIMVVQPRVATKRGVTVEFPAGLIEDNENIIEGVKRELLEETGYTCSNVKMQTEYYQDTATTSSTLAILSADHCQKVQEQKLDNDEFITYIEVTLKDIEELINKNYIVDGNTMLAVALIKLKNL